MVLVFPQWKSSGNSLDLGRLIGAERCRCNRRSSSTISGVCTGIYCATENLNLKPLVLLARRQNKVLGLVMAKALVAYRTVLHGMGILARPCLNCYVLPESLGLRQFMSARCN